MVLYFPLLKYYIFIKLWGILSIFDCLFGTKKCNNVFCPNLDVLLFKFFTPTKFKKVMCPNLVVFGDVNVKNTFITSLKKIERLNTVQIWFSFCPFLLGSTCMLELLMMMDQIYELFMIVNRNRFIIIQMVYD